MTIKYEIDVTYFVDRSFYSLQYRERQDEFIDAETTIYLMLTNKFAVS